MGQLWLDAWHGRSKVISEQWQRLAVTPAQPTCEIYGLGFWLNTAHRAFPSAPDNTFHAGGNSGQFVVVIPERRTGGRPTGTHPERVSSRHECFAG